MSTFSRVTCRRTDGVADCEGLPKRRGHHSPTGYEWGSFDGVVQLDMAIRAQQGEPFWVRADFLNLDGSPLASGLATVHVVEMQGGLAARIATDGALSAEGPLSFRTPGPLLVAPAHLHATGAGSLLTFVALVPQLDPADVAEAISTQVNTGAPVFFVRGRDLAAFGAPPLQDTATAIRGLAVFPVGDALTAALAVQGWIRSHGIPPLDQYTTIENALLRRHGCFGSGPADLALNILAAVMPRRDPGDRDRVRLDDRSWVSERVWHLHQHFKWELIARLPRHGFTLSRQDVEQWINTPDMAERKELCRLIVEREEMHALADTAGARW